MDDKGAITCLYIALYWLIPDKIWVSLCFGVVFAVGL